jgi:5-methyltetrahydropteroyltriglutamate--homocysteine methyltransferase
VSHQIIATHIGSLPRPEQLAILLDAEITGNAPGPELDTALDDAVTQTVAWQAGMGLDQVSDGEQDMTSFMEPG